MTTQAELALAVRRLPGHMHHAIVGYIMFGRPVGHFLTALLSNDFMKAVGYADGANVAALAAWAKFLHNDAPPGCYGSPERVREWIAKGGLEGGAS